MPTPTFACPHCGAMNVWTRVSSGKQARCACGQTIPVPDWDFLYEGDDGAELTLAPAAPPARKPTTVHTAAVVVERETPDGTVTTVAGGSRGKVAVDPTRLMHHKRISREKPPEPHRFNPFRDGVLPGLLIAIGLALCVAAGRYGGDGEWRSTGSVLGPVTVEIITSLALAVGAVFAASAAAGVAFGEPVPLVVYKLCAVALAPGAIGQLTGAYFGGLNGDIARVLVSLACYIALFVMLFRLAMADRILCVLLIFTIRAAVTYAIFRLEGAKKGSAI